MIRIKPADIGKTSTIVLFPGWISNGNWAIRRSHVANAASFTSEDTVRAIMPGIRSHQVRVLDTDDSMSRIMAAIGDNPKPFTVTKWTYDRQDKVRFALATNGAMHSYFNRAFLAFLEAGETLYARDAASAATNAIDPDDRQFVIMPAVIAKDGSHLTPLISLVHLLDAKADDTAAVA